VLTTNDAQPTAHDRTRHRVPAEQRRAQLLEAAIRAFSQKGFCGTKTKDIAAEAGVNEALLFRHFPTKDDLYAAILESVAADDWADSVREALSTVGDDAQLFVRELVRRTLAWYRQRPELLHLVLYSALEQHQLAEVFRDRQVRPVLDLLTNYIAERQQDGRFTSVVPAAHAARTVYGAIAHHGLAILLLRGAGTGMTDDEVAEAIAHVTLSGLLQKA
jgi:AcrR family transcriptional regulator